MLQEMQEIGRRGSACLYLAGGVPNSAIFLHRNPAGRNVSAEAALDVPVEADHGCWPGEVW